MGSLKTRGCKMCGGNVLWEKDKNGKYIFCVRCGTVYHEGFASQEETVAIEPAVKKEFALTLVR